MKYLFSSILIIITFAASAQTNPPKSMLDWIYPYDTKFIELSNNIKIAYVDEGKGKTTLIFIHGLGSYLKAWTKNIDALKTDYRCIALDLPGYGKSSKGDHEYNISFFSNIIQDFIKKLKLKNVVLVGHSMGGQIALATVLQPNKNIKKLILIAPAGFETFSESDRQWFANINKPLIYKSLPPEQIKRNFEVNFVQFPEDAHFMLEDRLYMRETAEYDRYCEMIPKCVNGMLQEPVFDDLPNVKLPTLILYGEKDALIPNRILHPTLTTLQVAEAGTKRIPHATLQMLPEAGHFAQWEQAALTNAAIRAFLK
ncbi:MAG: alpha/beta fold hydrolase [Saprospiraceae bacterium]